MAEIEQATLTQTIAEQVSAASRVMSDLEDSDNAIQSSNIATHAENLRRLFGSPVILVREKVAGNALLSEELAGQVSLDGEVRVLTELAKNSSISHQVAQALALSGFQEVRSALAEATSSLSIERILARDLSNSVRLALSKKAALDPVISGLIISNAPESENNGVLTELAKQTNLFGSSQDYLSSANRAHSVRLELAANTSILERTQIRLAEFQTREIKDALLENSALTTDARYVVNNTSVLSTPIAPTVPDVTSPTTPTVMTQSEPVFKQSYTARSVITSGDWVEYTATGVRPLQDTNSKIFGVALEDIASGSSGEILHFGAVEVKAHKEVSPLSTAIYLIVTELTSGDGTRFMITDDNTGVYAGKVIEISSILCPLESLAAGEKGDAFLNQSVIKATRGVAGPTGPTGPRGPAGVSQFTSAVAINNTSARQISVHGGQLLKPLSASATPRDPNIVTPVTARGDLPIGILVGDTNFPGSTITQFNMLVVGEISLIFGTDIMTGDEGEFWLTYQAHTFNTVIYPAGVLTTTNRADWAAFPLLNVTKIIRPLEYATAETNIARSPTYRKCFCNFTVELT